jgi:hypothetical protein
MVGTTGDHAVSGRGFADRPAVPRRIVGFHTDDEGHWVAELECGHTQHVRHDPPWQQRPWVTTPAGRAEHLGTELWCVRCAEGTEGRDERSGGTGRQSTQSEVGMEYPSHEHDAPRDGATEEPLTPAAEPQDDMTPPDGTPAAVGAPASGPESRPPHTVQRWTGDRRRGTPPGLVRAVDGVLDFLDAVGAAVRAAAGRPAG